MLKLFQRRWPNSVMGATSATRALVVGVAIRMLLLAACTGASKNNPNQAATVVAPPQAGAATPAAPAVQASSSAATGASSKVPILSAVLNAPTPAPPTALAAGVTATPPPPPATPPAAQTKDIIFYVDTVTASAGESPFNVDADKYCDQTSSFHRGMKIVFRATAYDNTGKELQPADMQNAVLKIPGNDDIKFSYGQHAPGVWFWTANFVIPPDYPLGVIDFSVVFTTNSGKTGTFKQLPISQATTGKPGLQSQLSVVS